MKTLFKAIIQVVHILSFCGVLLAGALGVIYEIVGYATFEKMLSSIGISKGFERIWIFSIIMLLLLIVTYFIKIRLFS